MRTSKFSIDVSQIYIETITTQMTVGVFIVSYFFPDNRLVIQILLGVILEMCVWDCIISTVDNIKDVVLPACRKDEVLLEHSLFETS